MTILSTYGSQTLFELVSSEQYQARFPQFCKEIANDLYKELCNFKFKDAVYWEHICSTLSKLKHVLLGIRTVPVHVKKNQFSQND